MTLTKSELITRIMTLRREVDSLMDMVIAMEDTPTEQAATIQHNDEWMTVKEVCESLKISDATFYARVKDGTFPQGVAFSPKSKRWRLSDIVAWQDKSQSHDAVDSPKTITRRKGRVSRLRKIEEFAYA